METFRRLTRVDVEGGGDSGGGPAALTVTPPSVAAGATGLMITVSGMDFENDWIIQLDGVDQTTGFGDNELVAINVVAKATPGTMAVGVRSTTNEIMGTGALLVT